MGDSDALMKSLMDVEEVPGQDPEAQKMIASLAGRLEEDTMGNKPIPSAQAPRPMPPVQQTSQTPQLPQQAWQMQQSQQALLQMQTKVQQAQAQVSAQQAPTQQPPQGVPQQRVPTQPATPTAVRSMTAVQFAQLPPAAIISALENLKGRVAPEKAKYVGDILAEVKAGKLPRDALLAKLAPLMEKPPNPQGMQQSPQVPNQSQPAPAQSPQQTASLQHQLQTAQLQQLLKQQQPVTQEMLRRQLMQQAAAAGNVPGTAAGSSQEYLRMALQQQQLQQQQQQNGAKRPEPSQPFPNILAGKKPRVAPPMPGSGPAAAPLIPAGPMGAGPVGPPGGPGGAKPKPPDDDERVNIKDISDVTRLAGVNLKEEAAHILWEGLDDHDNETKYSSDDDPVFLNVNALKKRLHDLAVKNGMKGIKDDVFEFMTQAVQDRLRSLLTKLVTTTTHSADDDKGVYTVAISSDVRRHIKLIEKKEREDAERKLAEEKERLLKEARQDLKKDKKDDKATAELREKLNKARLEEEDRIRTSAANTTALQAIGDIRLGKPKPKGPPMPAGLPGAALRPPGVPFSPFPPQVGAPGAAAGSTNPAQPGSAAGTPQQRPMVFTTQHLQQMQQLQQLQATGKITPQQQGLLQHLTALWNHHLQAQKQGQQPGAPAAAPPGASPAGVATPPAPQLPQQPMLPQQPPRPLLPSQPPQLPQQNLPQGQPSLPTANPGGAGGLPPSPSPLPPGASPMAPGAMMGNPALRKPGVPQPQNRLTALPPSTVEKGRQGRKITVRDLYFLLEREPNIRKSALLYKSYLGKRRR